MRSKIQHDITQHNDTGLKNTHYCDDQINVIQLCKITLGVMTFSIMTLSLIAVRTAMFSIVKLSTITQLKDTQ
jgi:hypothetical protein